MELWERRSNESYPAYEAFQKFLPALTALAQAGVKIERSARDLKRDKPQENLFVGTLSKIWTERGDDED